MDISSVMDKFDSLEIKDVSKEFQDEEEIITFIDHIFESPQYLKNRSTCKKTHQLLLHISNNDALYGNSKIRRIILDNIISKGFNVVKKVYYEEGKVDHSKDLMIVSLIMKLLDSLKIESSEKQKLCQELKDKSIELLKFQSKKLLVQDTNNDDLEGIYFDFVLWYLLFNKYISYLTINDYESIIPLIMSFGHLLNDDLSGTYDKTLNGGKSAQVSKEFNKIYRMIFVRFSSLNVAVTAKDSQAPINDIIYDEIETYIILQGTGSNVAEDVQGDWKKLLGFLKNYQLIVQVFPKDFSIMIFQSDMFLNFLNHIIRKLLKSFTLASILQKAQVELIINIMVIFEYISIDEGCIVLIIKNHLYLILELCRIPIAKDFSGGLIVSLASLLVIKCWNSYQQLKINDASNNPQTQNKIRELTENEAKIPNDLDLGEFYGIFVESLLRDNRNKYVEKYSIEGLAFISLKVKFKKKLRHNLLLIEKFARILTEQVEVLKNIDRMSIDDTSLVDESTPLSSEFVYGITILVSNISTFNSKLSKEEQSIEYLKNYSNANTIINNDERIKNKKLGVQEKDDDEDIMIFLQKIMQTKKLDFISCFTKIFKSMTTNIQDQLIKIIYNMSLQKKFRVELVKQGALNLVIEYLIGDEENFIKSVKQSNNKESGKDARYDNYMRLFALRALTKILISNNPNLVFHKYSVLVTIPFLCELLDDGTNYVDNGSQEVKLLHGFISKLVKPLDIFEALLSLTNIASLEDMKVKEAICNKSWEYLEIFILDVNENIQQGCLELISNLIFCPICTAKFFNLENSDSKKRFEILVKLVNSSNIKIQITALTIIVNASEYEMVAELLYNIKELFEKLVGILNNLQEYYESEDESSVNELLIRLVYLILNIVEAVKSDPKKLEIIKNYNFSGKSLKSGIDSTLRFVKDEEILAIIIEICKSLRYI
ncbi:She4 protein [Saccharomycopsis crataegensis]|uniref:She4 protein n=1 Tax=Saccharomycopsis crataegensis TaxID=43959 RepID=A0AAV5QP17_9ASCO|nr:She4 protein [Saccharomycopsis crataegensis]